MPSRPPRFRYHPLPFIPRLSLRSSLYYLPGTQILAQQRRHVPTLVAQISDGTTTTSSPSQALIEEIQEVIMGDRADSPDCAMDFANAGCVVCGCQVQRQHCAAKKKDEPCSWIPGPVDGKLAEEMSRRKRRRILVAVAREISEPSQNFVLNAAKSLNCQGLRSRSRTIVVALSDKTKGVKIGTLNDEDAE